MSQMWMGINENTRSIERIDFRKKNWLRLEPHVMYDPVRNANGDNTLEFPEVWQGG